MTDLDAIWADLIEHPTRYNEPPDDASEDQRAFAVLGRVRLGEPAPPELDDWIDSTADGDVECILCCARAMDISFGGSPLEAATRLNADIVRLRDTGLVHRLWSFLGTIYAELRRFDDAEQAFLESVDADPAPALRVPIGLINLGVLAIYSGRLGQAKEALERCLERVDPGSYAYRRGTFNLATIAARSGRLSEALDLFEQSQTFDGYRIDAGESHLEKGRALLDAGLVTEAMDALARADEAFRAHHIPHRVLQTAMARARVHTMQRDWATARAVVEDALATTAGIEETAEVIDARAALQVLDLLVDENATLDPDEGLTAHPDLAVDAGFHLLDRRPELARELLSAEATEGWTSSLRQVHAAAAAAALAWLESNQGAVNGHIDDFYDRADAQASVLGVSDVRAVLDGRVRQLTQVAARVAIENGDAHRLAEVIERERQLLFTPEPSLDDNERAIVDQIRARVRELESLPSGATRTLIETDLHGLENELRSLRQRHSGVGTHVEPETISDRPSVHLLGIGGEELWGAVFLSPTDERIVGPIDRSTLRRALVSAQTALSMNAGGVTTRLEKLIGGLRDILGPVVAQFDGIERFISITEPDLEPIPWALLTTADVHNASSLYEHRVAMTHDPPPIENVVLVGGPRLDFADRELDALQALHPDAVRIDPGDSSPDAVREAFRSADLVHFAAHGHFRADNPLMSNLELADGPLTFYDLLADGPVPSRLVFSSCEIGRNAGRSSLGLASVLIARGCRGLVTNSGAANDERSVALMTSMHTEMLAGATMAHALANAQAAVISEDPSVALFAAFGAI